MPKNKGAFWVENKDEFSISNFDPFDLFEQAKLVVGEDKCETNKILLIFPSVSDPTKKINLIIIKY